MQALTTDQIGRQIGVEVIFGLGEPPYPRGARIELQGPNGQPLGLVEVLESWVGPLGCVTAVHVEIARDPVCRSFSGLMTCLATVAQREVAPDEPAWALTIRRLGSAIKIAQVGAVSQLRKLE